jgi:hypothetical protein
LAVVFGLAAVCIVQTGSHSLSKAAQSAGYRLNEHSISISGWLCNLAPGFALECE